MSSEDSQTIDYVASPEFQTLLASFCRSAGVEQEVGEDSIGVEFTTDERVARVYPLADNVHAIVEIEILPLDIQLELEDPSRLLILHGLNNLTRLDSGWQACIDDDEILVISQRIVIATSDGEQLAGLMTDGLDRAQSLAEAWQGAGNWPGSEESDDAPGDVDMDSAIRG
jgi:hypothetical protein